MFRRKSTTGIVVLAILAVLLAACAQPQGPRVSPEQPNTNAPATLLPATEPVSDGETPSPDDTVSSDQPSAGAPSPLTPVPGEEKMAKGSAFVDSAEIATMESFPPQFLLQLSGSLPTPCHQLRVNVSDPDEQNRINVEVFSVVKPDEICIQVLEPFETSVNLGSYSAGTYTIVVNGKEVGQIQAP